MKVPKKTDEVRRFLGMVAYYNRFIQGFSTKLVNHFRDFDGLMNVIAFAELKKSLTTAPVLAYPDFRKPFFIHCNAVCDRGYA